MYIVGTVSLPTVWMNGEHLVSVASLNRMHTDVQNNFQSVAGELAHLRGELRVNQAVNKQLVQLLNWIAVTNPQILDEFQSTSHAFDKLLPADTGGENTAGPQA